MAGNITIKYGTNGQAFTLTLASLADAAARESTAISEISNVSIDALVFLKVTVGTPLASDKAVYVYAYGTVDQGTNYSDGATGTDAAITLTSPPNMRLIGVISTPTASTAYKGGPFSVAAAFGGVLPEKWGIVVLNKTGAALNATEANHSKLYQDIIAQYT